MKTYRNLLGIRTEVIECLGRVSSRVVIEISVGFIVGKPCVVSIGVRAVAAAIYVATHAGIDTDSTAAIYSSCNIVAAIDIVDIATTHKDTCRQFCRELIARQTGNRGIDTVNSRTDVCHTTTAIEVVNKDFGISHYLYQQALGTGHSTLVTSAVEVVHLTRLEVPRRTDVHLSLVIATKDAVELEVSETRIGMGKVESHKFATACFID